MFLTLPLQNDVGVTIVQIRRNGGAQRSANNNNKVMVAREGLEPPPLAFSGLDSLGLNPFSLNNLICQGGPSFVTIL